MRGSWLCHTTGYHELDASRSCSSLCVRNRYKKFAVSTATFTGCIDGHEICHDGIIQCPRCRESNKPRNRVVWKCRRCKKQFYDMNARQFDEHCVLCSAGFPKEYLDLQKKGKLVGDDYWRCNKCWKQCFRDYSDCQRHENECIGFDFHSI